MVWGKKVLPRLRDFYILQSKETTQESFQDFVFYNPTDRELKNSFIEWYNPG